MYPPTCPFRRLAHHFGSTPSRASFPLDVLFLGSVQLFPGFLTVAERLQVHCCVSSNCSKSHGGRSNSTSAKVVLVAFNRKWQTLILRQAQYFQCNSRTFSMASKISILVGLTMLILIRACYRQSMSPTDLQSFKQHCLEEMAWFKDFNARSGFFSKSIVHVSNCNGFFGGLFAFLLFGRTDTRLHGHPHDVRADPKAYLRACLQRVSKKE